MSKYSKNIFRTYLNEAKSELLRVLKEGEHITLFDLQKALVNRLKKEKLTDSIILGLAAAEVREWDHAQRPDLTAEGFWSAWNMQRNRLIPVRVSKEVGAESVERVVLGKANDVEIEAWLDIIYEHVVAADRKYHKTYAVAWPIVVAIRTKRCKDPDDYARKVKGWKPPKR